MKHLEPVNHLSFPRLVQLCKLTIYKNRQNWLTGLLAASGIILAIWMLPILLSVINAGELRGPSDYSFATFVFVLWGLLVTSDIFQELHSPATAYQSLTLPATSSEKFLTAWIITFPILFLVFILSIFSISLIVSLIYGVLNGTFTYSTLYLPFTSESVDLANQYFYYNSLFLLGAILFRKNNFLKTLLAIITIVITFFFISAVIMFVIATGTGADSFSFRLDDPNLMNNISLIFKFVVAFTSLLLTYVLLKKRQVAK